MNTQIDEAGRTFLANRLLSISNAERLGVYSSGGEIAWPFYRNGKVVRWKYRNLEDKKKQRFNIIDDPAFIMPFWNQRNTPTIDHLIITEGEFDCMAITQLGPFNCVSLPNGASAAKKAITENYEYLQQFEVIYIAFDMDEPGNKAAMQAMAMLPPAKYRRIHFPRKDANEWIIKDAPNADDLLDLMRNAERINSETFLPMSHVPPEFFEEIPLGQPTGWHRLNQILGGLRLGEVTVISADTGAGKSTFCINLMYNLAGQKIPVWINSYEMHYFSVLRKFASIALRAPLKNASFTPEQRKYFDNFTRNHSVYVNKANAKTDLKTLRHQIEQAALAYEVPFILLDHLDYIHSAGAKSTTLENIDDAIREIHTLALEYNVHILLVAHPIKTPSNQELTMSDIKGSSAIKQYADNILILNRMDRIDPRQINILKVSVCKNRMLGHEGSFLLNYMKDYDCYMESF